MKISISIEYQSKDGEHSIHENFAAIESATGWIETVGADCLQREAEAFLEKKDQDALAEGMKEQAELGVMIL